MTKYVYFFGGGKAEGRADMKDLLGGKGANLAEMTNIGLPVPAGFTLTTEVCTYYDAHGRSYPPEVRQQVEAAGRKPKLLSSSALFKLLVPTSLRRWRLDAGAGL
jgi:pyruvate,orthophosphate dikinase